MMVWFVVMGGGGAGSFFCTWAANTLNSALFAAYLVPNKFNISTKV